MEILNITDIQHRALIVMVNKNWNGTNYQALYRAANFAWPVNKSRAERVEIVLAVYRRTVAGVFIPYKWLEANINNFPSQGTGERSDRYGFVGEEASPGIQELYIGKRLAEELRSYGGSIRYVHC